MLSTSPRGFDPGPRPDYGRAVRTGALIGVLLATACGAPAPPAPPPSGPVEALGAPERPVVVALDSSRAHVVRLSETTGGGAPARLRLSSATPGASVAIDGGPFAPLPLDVELAPGPHGVTIACQDGRRETRQFQLTSGGTVTLRLCSPPQPE